MAPKRHYLPLLLLSLLALFFYSYHHSSLHTPNSFNPELNINSLNNPNPTSNFTLTVKLLPLLLLSLLALFFYSYHHSSLHTPNSFNPELNINSLYDPNPTSNFTLTIKLLAFDRLESISRCLRSLANADYGNDRVNLHIYIDHFIHPDPGKDGSGTLILDKKLGDSHRILEFVDGFVWNFGQKLVHYRTGNAGLQAQWLEAWWPSSDNDFAFIVEDDLEVSPLYYKFLRALILNYYYNASNFNPSIYGASLQRPRFVPGKHGNKLQLESETRLFLYQLVGTWGQLLFPRPWKDFRLWYDTHRAKGIKPFLQGMVTTGWYKKMGERIWTPWFIKFIHTRGYFNIYTHFLHERALSISHRDAGVNYGKTAGPDSYLLDKTTLDFNLLETQPLSHLKWFDFCFREVHPGRVIKSLDELGPVLPSVQKHETIVFISLFRASEIVTRNLVCHFERLNIENYIFIGRKSDFLLDLARRGHPVIEADQFVHDIKSKGFQESSVEILVKVHIIKKCLELKYNSWVVDGNLVFNSSDLFLNYVKSSYDFYAGNSVELLFVRSSSAVWKIWVDDVLMSKSLLLDTDFMRVVIKLLEKDKGVKVKRIDETSIGLKIEGGNVNRTIVMDGKKMVFWSLGMGMELVQKRLEELGMWIIDNDSSCLAVVCHQS